MNVTRRTYFGCLAMLICCALFCPGMLNAGICTTLDTTTLTAHVPCISVGEYYYWIDITLTGDVFRLTDIGAAEETNACAEFDADSMTVHILCADLDAANTYWFDLAVQPSEDIDLAVTTGGENTGNLVINEILAKDASGGNDWIELYVKGSESVNLADYFLADADSEKSSLPSVTLSPGQFYLIQATDEAPTDGSSYVPFKLGSSDGLILYEGENMIDVFDWEDGDVPTGFSYGRLPDGSGVPRTLSPTPGAANEAGDSTNTRIVLNHDSVTIYGSGATAVGSIVTIASSGRYSISGSLTDGRIIVDTEDEAAVNLVLNGVDIHCSTGAPVYVANAEETLIFLADNTDNYISDGTSYTLLDPETDEPNAAVFSKDDLTISGGGSLTVDANYNDGIASKDDLVISGGTITVISVDDGMRGKDSLEIESGIITVNAQGDGLKSDNEEDAEKGLISIEDGQIQVTSGGDAIQAATDVTITGGEILLTSGGGSNGYVGSDESAKGIKGTVSVHIEDGVFSIDSADDAIHSNGSIVITSGVFSIASGDDGIHADASVDINGGDMDISDSYEGIESAVITITDGDIRIVSSDDGINVAGGKDGSGMNRPTGPGDDFINSGDYFLYISGGYIVADADGDGIDVNGSIEMTAGVVLVNGPLSDADSALDYDGSFKISGGFLVGTGSSGMAQAPDTSSTQNSLLLNFTSSQQAGSLIHIQSSAGSGILTFAPSKRYESLAFSSPELISGSSYEVYTGGSSTGTVNDGLYENGTYTPGTIYASFTVSGTVTNIGNGGNNPF